MQQYRSIYQSAYEMFLPERNTYTESSEGARKALKVYDSAPLSAADGFVRNMIAALTPPFQRWAQLKSGPFLKLEGNIRGQVDKALESVTDVVFKALDASNFHTAVGEFYYDLMVGTAAMIVREGDFANPLIFEVAPVSSIALEEGANGLVDTIFRKFCLKAGAIKEQWKDAKIPEALAEIVKEKPETNVDLVECTYRMNGRVYYDLIWSGNASNDEAQRIVEREYKTMPWLVVRWSKIAGELLGRGPAIKALPDAQTLNKFKEFALTSAAWQVMPVWLATSDAELNPSTLQIKPPMIIPVGRTGGPAGPSIQRLDVGGNYTMQTDITDRLTMQIKELLIDRRLPPDAGPVRSATEIMQRIKELQFDIGAAFGRLMYEFINPLFERVLDILSRLGHIKLPKQLSRIDNFNVAIQVLSPIAREQQLQDVDALVKAFEVTRAIDQQAAAREYKLEEVASYVADNMGVLQRLRRDQAEKEDYDKKMAQMAAMAAMMQQGGAGAAQQPV
jgi:hypothetical protein